MKLSSKTIDILKSFSSINPSILVKPGNILSTISPSKTIMAKAIVEDSFEREFAIFDITRLLNVVSLFTNPEIELGETSLTISNQGKSITYNYTDKNMFTCPPNKELKLPSEDVVFSLEKNQFEEVMKAKAILGHDNIVVLGNGENISLRAMSVKTPNNDVYSINVGKSSSNFMTVFSPDNLKLIPTKYEVKISKKGISHWQAENLEYFVAVEGSSKYDE